MNTRKILLGLGLGGMYYMNYLGSATEKLGVKISALASIFPFSFMPPGWAFMVSWATIFIGLFIYYLLLCFKKTKYSIESQYLISAFGVTIFLNIAWLLATGQRYFVLSVVIIALLGLSIAKIILYLKDSHQEKSLGWAVWGIYYGWVLIATIVIGISQVVYSYTPEFALSTTWGYFILTIGFIATALSYWKLKNIFALLWSLFALGACIFAFL